jgi:membrane associated rhomboid family serine protease
MPAAPPRSDLPPWLRPVTERLSPTIRALVIALALPFATFVFSPPARAFIEAHLVLGPGLFAGEIWQPVTALLFHTQALSFFFTLLGLWFAGAGIERQIGRARFLVLLLVPALVANVVMAGASRLLARPEVLAPGLGLGVLGLFAALGRLWGRTPARVLGSLVLEARYLAALLVGFSVFIDLTRLAWTQVLGDLAAAGLAWAIAGRRGAGTVVEDLSARRPPRRRFQVMEGGRGRRGDDGPRYLN